MIENLRDLFGMLWVRRKFLLIPLFLVLAILGTFLAFASSSALAPFLYTLF